MPSVRLLCLLGSTFLAAYSMPHSGHETPTPPTLPASNLPPPTGLNLKVIALGVGHQNYTCNSTSGTYGSNVALADLFDATRYLSRHQDQVCNLAKQRLDQYIKSGECEEEADVHPELELIGEHYFEASSPPSPDFDLYELDLFLSAKKVNNVPAPDTAKDIDWLYLMDNGKGKTNGLKAVYRVETAGGKPPATCSGNEKIYVPYVAQYWFYD